MRRRFGTGRLAKDGGQAHKDVRCLPARSVAPTEEFL